MSYSPSGTDEDVLAEYPYRDSVWQSGDLPYSELGSSLDGFAQLNEPVSMSEPCQDRLTS